MDGSLLSWLGPCTKQPTPSEESLLLHCLGPKTVATQTQFRMSEKIHILTGNYSGKTAVFRHFASGRVVVDPSLEEAIVGRWEMLHLFTITVKIKPTAIEPFSSSTRHSGQNSKNSFTTGRLGISRCFTVFNRAILKCVSVRRPSK